VTQIVTFPDQKRVFPPDFFVSLGASNIFMFSLDNGILQVLFYWKLTKKKKF